MRTFEAKYRGTCSDCGGRVEEGDEVAYVDGQLIHGDGECSVQEAAAEPAAPSGTCGTCFTVRTVTGACNCDPE